MLDATRLLYSTPPRVVPANTFETSDVETDNKLTKDTVSLNLSITYNIFNYLKTRHQQF